MLVSTKLKNVSQNRKVITFCESMENVDKFNELVYSLAAFGTNSLYLMQETKGK